MNITASTAAALAITASLVLSVGAGASDSVIPAEGDYASAGLIQRGYGPGGRSAPLVHGFEYGSAQLIQLGHGPGGPSRAPLGE